MARKGTWMQTYSGRAYWPLAPRAHEVNLIDIAVSLSRQCRYGGHSLRHYSVAEHSVLIARSPRCPPEAKLAALLHDSPETYCIDVPRPLKQHLLGYADIERLNMAAIAERFGLSLPLPAVVYELDNAILHDERDQAMSRPPRDWCLPGEPLGVTLQFWTPQQAAREFTQSFFEFGGKL